MSAGRIDFKEIFRDFFFVSDQCIFLSVLHAVWQAIISYKLNRDDAIFTQVGAGFELAPSEAPYLIIDLTKASHPSSKQIISNASEQFASVSLP